MSRYLIDKYQALEAYTPGEQPRDMQYIKLNTNESPYPPAPGVVEAVREQAGRLELYSDPVCTELRDALAARYGVRRENVFVSNGSDDILNFAFMAFGGPRAFFPDISYGFYPVYAELHGIEAHSIPLRQDFSIDPSDFMALDGFIAIANPNAPTGMALGVAQIEDILSANPDHVVLIDEAYVDFGAESCVPLTAKYDNLLVVQTFSKSRSMAGARLGFAIAHEALIADLEKIKFSTNPYSVNRMTLAAGIATLKADEVCMENCRKVVETREATVARLRQLGFEVLPSKANFVFARHPHADGGFLYRQLKARGVLVRHFENPRIKDFLRITIGTPRQMEALIEKLGEILSGTGV
ncbi:MAG: histidinol-phosphate transaminase [Clostridia bacterium]|nr:histidinol-phosphate transaminase [Clostridia bacterium]